MTLSVDFSLVSGDAQSTPRFRLYRPVTWASPHLILDNSSERHRKAPEYLGVQRKGLRSSGEARYCSN